MRRVVITGGSRGIGFETALAFCCFGDQVLITGRDKSKLHEAVLLIKQEKENAQIDSFSADSSDETAIDELASYVLETFGGCDILINNAGVFVPGAIHSEEEGNYKFMMLTNMDSAYHLTRSLLPDMLEKQKGDIVNICSIASSTAYANGGSYSISKFALLGFSKNLREELKPHGIRVISVLPGATYTDSWSDVDIDENRLMPSKDIAQTILHTCNLSRRTVVEEIVLRPQLGDL